MRRAFTSALVLTLVFVSDRFTKTYFMHAAAIPRSPLRQQLSSIVDITPHKNFGLLANFPVPMWLILTSTTLVLLVIGWKLVGELTRNASDAPISSSYISLTLILGGALGNMYDRVSMGFVFDWIWLFHRSVVNLADAAIAVGIGWFLICKRSRG